MRSTCRPGCVAAIAAIVIFGAIGPAPLLADWHGHGGGGPPDPEVSADMDLLIFWGALPALGLTVVSGPVLIIFIVSKCAAAGVKGMILMVGAGLGYACGMLLLLIACRILDLHLERPWIGVIGGGTGLLIGLGLAALINLLVAALLAFIARHFGRKKDAAGQATQANA